MADAGRAVAFAAGLDPLSHAVLQALDNERQLDLQFRQAFTELGHDRSVPNYKVMKQLALRQRLGRLYALLIAVAPWAVSVLALLQWPIVLGRTVFGRVRPRDNALYIWATAPSNVGLIDAALAQCATVPNPTLERHLLTSQLLREAIGVRDFLSCVMAHARLLVHIMRCDAERRTDLLLHARDAVDLLLLIRFAQRHPHSRFATEDHYQRWAFLLSHHSQDLHIIQHGFITPDIPFPNPFGAAKMVYLRDLMFQSSFANYYRVGTFVTFSPPTRLHAHPLSDQAVFLASSYPSIDAEILLVTSIKAQRQVPIFVKFHPSHVYDARKNLLADLADHVCADTDVPACRLFVSNNSFMEFDYQGSGIVTFSIARAGGPEAAAQAIVEFLDQNPPTRLTPV